MSEIVVVKQEGGMDSSNSFSMEDHVYTDCLLCLREFSLTSSHGVGVDLMRLLLRYLNVDVTKLCHPASKFSWTEGDNQNKDLPVCQKCAGVTNNFGDLYQQLEFIRLQIQTCVKQIYDHLIASMEADGEILDEQSSYQYQRVKTVTKPTELIRVSEDLRNETAKKCLRKLKTSKPRVLLTNLNLSEANTTTFVITSSNLQLISPGTTELPKCDSLTSTLQPQKQYQTKVTSNKYHHAEIDSNFNGYQNVNEETLQFHAEPDPFNHFNSGGDGFDPLQSVSEDSNSLGESLHSGVHSSTSFSNANGHRNFTIGGNGKKKKKHGSTKPGLRTKKCRCGVNVLIDSYSEHMRVVHKLDSYQHHHECGYCFKRFTSNNEVRRHTLALHYMETWEHAFPPGTTKQDIDTSIHILVNLRPKASADGQDYYSCLFCPCLFRNNISNLRVHIISNHFDKVLEVLKGEFNESELPPPTPAQNLGGENGTIVLKYSTVDAEPVPMVYLDDAEEYDEVQNISPPTNETFESTGEITEEMVVCLAK